MKVWMGFVKVAVLMIVVGMTITLSACSTVQPKTLVTNTTLNKNFIVNTRDLDGNTIKPDEIIESLSKAFVSGAKGPI